MDTLISYFYILIGLLLRLAIPIAATMLVVYILRRLDKRWQAEAETAACRDRQARMLESQGLPAGADRELHGRQVPAPLLAGKATAEWLFE